MEKWCKFFIYFESVSQWTHKLCSGAIFSAVNLWICVDCFWLVLLQPKNIRESGLIGMDQRSKLKIILAEMSRASRKQKMSAVDPEKQKKKSVVVRSDTLYTLNSLRTENIIKIYTQFWCVCELFAFFSLSISLRWLCRLADMIIGFWGQENVTRATISRT